MPLNLDISSYFDVSLYLQPIKLEFVESNYLQTTKLELVEPEPINDPEDPDDPRIQEVRDSFENELERALKIFRASSSDWSPGNGLTTGICVAYAFECVDHIKKYGHHEVLPPLITTKPSELIKFLEMQLPRAIFKSLKRGQHYEDVTFAQKNYSIINQSCQAFATFIENQTGLKIVGQYPNPDDEVDFTAAIPLDGVDSLITNLSHSDEEHHMLFLHNPDQHLSAAHIIYINFKKGIIGDGANGLMWKIPSHCYDLFKPALKKYLQKFYSSQFKEISSITIRRDSNPFWSWVPLTIRKIILYSNLLFNLARTEGIKKSAKTCYRFIEDSECVKSVVKTIEKVQLIWENTYSNIVWISRILPCFVSSAKRQEELIKFCHENDIKTVRLLLKIGAKADEPHEEIYPLTVACDKNNAQLVRMLIASGAKPKPQHLWLSCLNNNIELVRLFLEKGVDPNDKLFKERGLFPLIAAVQNGSLEMVDCLLAAKANPNCLGSGGPLFELACKFSTLGDSDKEARESCIRIAKALLKAGAKPKAYFKQVLPPIE